MSVRAREAAAGSIGRARGSEADRPGPVELASCRIRHLWFDSSPGDNPANRSGPRLGQAFPGEGFRAGMKCRLLVVEPGCDRAAFCSHAASSSTSKAYLSPPSSSAGILPSRSAAGARPCRTPLPEPTSSSSSSQSGLPRLGGPFALMESASSGSDEEKGGAPKNPASFTRVCDRAYFFVRLRV